MKRRDFLTSSVLGAIGINMASCSTRGTEPGSTHEQSGEIRIPQYKSGEFSSGTARLQASDKIVLALIGAGSWGSNLALVTGNLGENVEFRYVCDVDDTRGGRAISELGKIQGHEPRRVRDMRVVFDDPDVDAVIVATPTHWHALAALWAMQAGKDVYVEKCITHNVVEGQILAHAAMKYGRVFQCGLQNRSARYNREAAEVVRSGKLGRVLNATVYCLLNGPVPFNERTDEATPHHIDWDKWLGPAPEVPYSVSRNKSWLYYWDYSTGLSFEDNIHQVDLMRLLLGDPGMPLSVTCSGGRFSLDDGRETPDIQSVICSYDGFTVNLLSGDFTPYMYKASPEIRHGDGFPEWINSGDKIVIYGTEAMMVLGRMGGGWQVIGRDGEIIAQMPGRFPLEDNLRNFLDCIRSRDVPNANIVQGHLSSSLLHYANISHKLGNRQLEISGEYESVLNNPEANELCAGYYRKGYEPGKV